MAKAWSYFNGDLIWSYYLELCTAEFLKKDSGIVYSHDLCNFFNYMVERALAPFETTPGCAEPVYGTSIAGKEAAMNALQCAAEAAHHARTCEQRGNVVDAFYWWRKVFDWRFAAY